MTTNRNKFTGLHPKSPLTDLVSFNDSRSKSEDSETEATISSAPTKPEPTKNSMPFKKISQDQQNVILERFFEQYQPSTRPTAEIAELQKSNYRTLLVNLLFHYVKPTTEHYYSKHSSVSNVISDEKHARQLQEQELRNFYNHLSQSPKDKAKQIADDEKLARSLSKK